MRQWEKGDFHDSHCVPHIGGFAHVYLVTTDKPISVPVSATTIPGGTAVTTRGETLHVLKRMAVPDKESLASVRNEVEIHVRALK